MVNKKYYSIYILLDGEKHYYDFATCNYIKIDVDGIEHLILEGASDHLDNSEIRSMSIELNENFKDQVNSVLKIMDKSNFRFKNKKHASMFDNSDKFSKIFNYIFEKQK